MTDENFALGILDSINLTVPKNGANAGKVVSSTPGQVSDNVLIANTCASDQSFDLAIVLDPDFQTNPHDNPGNAVFTYSTSGIVDENSFNISAFGTGTGQHQTLCLQSVTVAANTSFLAAVHANVMNVTASTLPTDFDFAASLVTENSGCSGQLDTLADPNPAGFSLPYTIKIN